MEIIHSDAAGQLSIPEKLYHALGLKPGMKLQIKKNGKDIILTKLEDLEDGSSDGLESEDLMKMSEESLTDFLDQEPDLYTEADLKVKYQ